MVRVFTSASNYGGAYLLYYYEITGGCTIRSSLDAFLFLLYLCDNQIFFADKKKKQADVCHAYQILKRGGLKDENIVVFMYDDIAKSELNPRQGILINHPQGQDVYAGVPKVRISSSSSREN